MSHKKSYRSDCTLYCIFYQVFTALQFFNISIDRVQKVLSRKKVAFMKTTFKKTIPRVTLMSVKIPQVTGSLLYKNIKQSVLQELSFIREFNPFTPESDFIYFTLSYARRFYSSKGDPLGVKGLKKLSPLTLSLLRVTLYILLCLLPDDFTHQRETPWEWKG